MIASDGSARYEEVFACVTGISGPTPVDLTIHSEAKGLIATVPIVLANTMYTVSIASDNQLLPSGDVIRMIWSLGATNTITNPAVAMKITGPLST